MNFFKNIDFKSWVIIILGLTLVVTIIFHKSKPIQSNQSDIDLLHKDNEILNMRNDSLNLVNKSIFLKFDSINNILVINCKYLKSTQKELDRLKNKQNETHSIVSSLSANGVANSFSEYLNTKGTSTHK